MSTTPTVRPSPFPSANSAFTRVTPRTLAPDEASSKKTEGVVEKKFPNLCPDSLDRNSTAFQAYIEMRAKENRESSEKANRDFTEFMEKHSQPKSN